MSNSGAAELQNAHESVLQGDRHAGRWRESGQGVVRRFLSFFVSRGDRWVVIGAPSVATDIVQTLYDLDYRALTLVVLAGYIIVALAFAAAAYYPAMLLDEASFRGDLPSGLSSFTAMFYMSLGVLAQAPVALSRLEPASSVTYTVVAVEHFVGILMSACFLGVLITKASIPRAQVVFSDKLLWTSRNGVPYLLFRLGNASGNFLLHPEFRISYMRMVNVQEGGEIFQLSPITCEAPPSLAPCFTVACRITEDSPLWHKTYADLQAEQPWVQITVSATDNRHFQPVFVTRRYFLQDMRFNCRFADAMATEGGHLAVDFTAFNNVVQNDAMPVMFGLTRDELLLVNQGCT